MTTKKVFKSTHQNIRFITREGKNIIFTDFKHITDNEDDIRELMREIKYEGVGKSHHPDIYVDPNEAEVDTKAPTTVDEFKKQVIEDYLRANGLLNDRDMGNTSAASNIGVGTTNIVAGTLAQPKLVAPGALSTSTKVGTDSTEVPAATIPVAPATVANPESGAVDAKLVDLSKPSEPAKDTANPEDKTVVVTETRTPAQIALDKMKADAAAKTSSQS